MNKHVKKILTWWSGTVPEPKTEEEPLTIVGTKIRLVKEVCFVSSRSPRREPATKETLYYIEVRDIRSNGMDTLTGLFNAKDAENAEWLYNEIVGSKGQTSSTEVIKETSIPKQ